MTVKWINVFRKKQQGTKKQPLWNSISDEDPEMHKVSPLVQIFFIMMMMRRRRMINKGKKHLNLICFA